MVESTAGMRQGVEEAKVRNASIKHMGLVCALIKFVKQGFVLGN